MTGSYGDLSILSFAPNKILTTGEGGAILTNSSKLFNKLKLIRSHGRIETHNYFSSHTKPAALGISQFHKLKRIISLRRTNANYLSTRLKKFEQIKIPLEPHSYKHVYQLYSIELSTKRIRDELFKFLTKKRIMSKVYFYPVHKSKFYQKFRYSKETHLPVTEKLSEKILSLPMYPNLTKGELKYIINSISEFMEKN